jgi:hypothetical protein
MYGDLLCSNWSQHLTSDDITSIRRDPNSNLDGRVTWVFFESVFCQLIADTTMLFQLLSPSRESTAAQPEIEVFEEELLIMQGRSTKFEERALQVQVAVGDNRANRQLTALAAAEHAAEQSQKSIVRKVQPGI